MMDDFLQGFMKVSKETLVGFFAHWDWLKPVLNQSLDKIC